MSVSVRQVVIRRTEIAMGRCRIARHIERSCLRHGEAFGLLPGSSRTRRVLRSHGRCGIAVAKISIFETRRASIRTASAPGVWYIYRRGSGDAEIAEKK
jgi:hypothetical protein